MDGRELLKRYDAYKEEALSLRDENRFLRGERDHYRRKCFFTQQHLNKARESNRKLRDRAVLRPGQAADQTDAAAQEPTGATR